MTRPAVRHRASVPATIALALIWVLLWGEPSLGAVIWGLGIALAVQVLFPLPHVPELQSFRLFGFLRLVLVTLGGLIVSSFQVAAKVLAFWRPTQNAIIRVQLRSSSIFVAVITAELITLVPGSVAVDAGEGWLLVHVFDASSETSIERARASVLATEATVLRAFGGPEHRALLEED